MDIKAPTVCLAQASAVPNGEGALFDTPRCPLPLVPFASAIWRSSAHNGVGEWRAVASPSLLPQTQPRMWQGRQTQAHGPLSRLSSLVRSPKCGSAGLRARGRMRSPCSGLLGRPWVAWAAIRALAYLIIGFALRNLECKVELIVMPSPFVGRCGRLAMVGTL